MTEVTLDWSARIYSPRLLVRLVSDAEDICRMDGQSLVAVHVHPRTLRQYQESIPGWVDWFMAAPVQIGNVTLLGGGPVVNTPGERWRRTVRSERIDAPI